MTENNEHDDLDFEIDLDALGAADDVEVDDLEIDLGADLSDEAVEEAIALSLGGDDKDDEEEEESSSDADEALAKALAELREELEGKWGEWYVIHTYSGMENRVKQNIEARVQSFEMEDYIFEAIVPTEEVVEVRNNARKTVTRSVLPGYVLVRMELTDDSWGIIRHTPSVTGFVGNGQTAVPLSIDEVLHMLTPSVKARVNAELAGAQPKLKKKVEVVDFAVGDSVMVTDGPFAGIHASITEINANTNRLRALVEILGRETPVDLEFRQVSKVV
ncbi:transcription termination/antitermination protein NusG [Tessaracoccus sp. OH4464_COT-324]|uniref:transcription termination/antitermination protein NusG n=1 Tax=Tessaracoccus sp. OH4464_COT-324 TaxID=2491059 RepID=UPI000F63967C|nr:transcription termination/antitermination protein NusG [Tessaracoccus sp. OH4464_COT-324]RRD47005.1 transcription termination/antitermination protein NusG [Tessaracoccus sp. OH4464_COT-324]